VDAQRALVRCGISSGRQQLAIDLQTNEQRIDVEALRESEQASSTNWSELAEDPVFRGSISVIQAAYATAVRGAKSALDESRMLREQVETHLE
jgi:hypothetical protein